MKWTPEIGEQLKKIRMQFFSQKLHLYQKQNVDSELQKRKEQNVWMDKRSSETNRSTVKAFLSGFLHAVMGALCDGTSGCNMVPQRLQGNKIMYKWVMGGKQVSCLTNVNISKGFESNVKFRKDKCQFINSYNEISTNTDQQLLAISIEDEL